MAEIIEERASQAGHWYKKDGSPAYTVIGKNGKERATTLRDAKKEGLVPSVTTILKEANKPALATWIQKQVLMAALTLTRNPEESDEAFINRIMEDSKQQAIKAAERGTQIHTWIQQGFEGVTLQGDAEIYFHIAQQEIQKHCGECAWKCEQSFSTDGYGGKVDLPNDAYVIDIKTKDTPLDGILTYDEHAMQLGAYRRGLRLPSAKCGILFVSTKTIEAKLVWIEEEKLKRGEAMFMDLLSYWYNKSGLTR